MLDDHILHEEYHLKGYRSQAFLRFFLFFWYFLIWTILFISIVRGFIKEEQYRKSEIPVQVLLALTGCGFAWGMGHCILRQIAYFREFVNPNFQVYQRKISELEFHSNEKKNRVPSFHLAPNVQDISEARLYDLKRKLHPNAINQSDKSKLVYVIVGKYSGRIWAIKDEIEDINI